MADTTKRLFPAQYRNNAMLMQIAQALYTVPTSGVTSVTIVHIRFANTSASQQSPTLFIGTPDAAMTFEPSPTIPPGGVWSEDLKIDLFPGESIFGKADADNKVTCWIEGVVTT